MAYRRLAAGQRAQVRIGGPELDRPELLFETGDVLIEAPNWSLDSSALFLNGHGSLWRLDLGAPERGLIAVGFEELPELNNDHVLDPDGEHIYLSADDGHIYRGALGGGAVDRVSPDDGSWHFLHGVAPDGSRLAYVHLRGFAEPERAESGRAESGRAEPGRLAVMEPHGRPVVVDTGRGHIDGPEWSPDGAWIHFNTEGFTTEPGHAQLARIPDTGGAVERLVVSDTVDWFPHLSPDGAWASYLAFPAGTLGHPADLDVEVRVVATADWSAPVQRYPAFGGQGTLNVNSWAPDSRRFAFVAYPGTGS